MAVLLPPAPEFAVDAPIVKNSISGRFTQAMRYWLITLADRVDLTPVLSASVTATAQVASVTATNFPLITVLPGLYRLSMAARVTTAATTSSSLIVTFGWTQAVACTTASTAMTGNTTATTSTLSVLVRVDKDSAITYATTYVSVGATPMAYRLDVTCEQVL
jgi:hypothetical protein